MHILHQGRAGKPRPYEVCVCLKIRKLRIYYLILLRQKIKIIGELNVSELNPCMISKRMMIRMIFNGELDLNNHSFLGSNLGYQYIINYALFFS